MRADFCGNLIHLSTMRVSQNQQMLMGEVDVSNITFNPRSRDDMPKILRGLGEVAQGQSSCYAANGEGPVRSDTRLNK